MTSEPAEATPEVQAAINGLYQQAYQKGFEDGRRKGYAEGIAAVRKHMDMLPARLPEQLPLDTPLEELDLTIRSYNCLRREGIFTIGDVIKRTEYQLEDIRNFGRNSMVELKEKLRLAGGYTLSNDPVVNTDP